MDIHTGWTEARVARLKQLWTDGLSASGVARALGGVSRSAVLGKLLRLGLLKTRKPASAPRGLDLEGGSDEAKLAAAFRLHRSRPRREPPPTPWRADAFQPLAGSAPRPWLSRGPGECAFPVGGEGEGTLSCCARTRGAGAYCPHHHAIVFRASPAQATAPSPNSSRSAA